MQQRSDLFVATLALPLVLLGCGILEPLSERPANDGTVCQDDSDCSTEYCTSASLCSHTVCTCPNGSCPPQGEAVEACPEDWVCVDATRLSDPIVDFFGGMPAEDEGYCHPRCEDGCPEHYTCDDEGVFCNPDRSWSAPVALLSWSGAIEGSSTGSDPPGRAIVERGTTIQLHGEGTSPTGASITDIHWQIVESSGDRTEYEDAQIPLHVPADATFVRAELTVLDDKSRAGITHVIFDTCVGAGEPCGYQGSGCCNTCDDAGELCL